MTTICTACRHENRAGAAFCEECGARLERRCPSCGSPLGATAKFCGECGTPLAARTAQTADDSISRKVVTIVFADLIGSMSLHERLDPESVSRVMDRYHRAVSAPVEAHGGTVVQLLGDGVMCAFGVPHVAEDDAIRAVRAAVDVQRAFKEFASQESALVGTIGLRVAVNTGEVVVSDDRPAGVGDPLNVAARLQSEARDGEVLIGEATERLVRNLVTLERSGVFSLKGRADPVAAYRVVSLDRPAGVSATPFVGREDELKRITAVYDATIGGRRARLAVVLGSPGLGKSRLMDEFGRRLDGGTTVLRAHCDTARGATFGPVATALRAHLGIDDAAGGDAVRAAVRDIAKGDDAERARIAEGIAAILAGTPASPEETFFVVRRLLAGLAADRPLVLAIDDLQWAEPLLLDLVEHLIQWTTEVPLLVLVAARPELREARSSLATAGGLVADVVTLAGLDAAAATRLAASVIGADKLPASVAGRVLATSEGNPLFVGELVRMLVSDGALKRDGERWTADAELARLEMPPTIQALLAARIERLRPEERTVLERAAVVGRQFSRAAVTHLLPREIADLDARLEALRRSELIEPDTGWLLGEPVLRFHHVLIRDAAYRRLLKNTRAELHERFADWLAGRAGDAVEHEETLGWHLEQAHQNLRELGPVDAHGRALGERAARHLAAAGRRALAREDLPLAANLLGRAIDRLDAADPARADLALDWCEALLAAGDVGEAVGAVDELGRFTAESARLRAWHTCFASQLAVFTDPKNLRATASTVAAAAEELAAAGDAAGEAKGHYVNAMALSRLGKVGACEAALDRALAAARRAGDRRRSNAVLAGAPIAALWGPSPVTRASGRCLDVVRVLRITEGAPAVEAVALRCQGVLEALRGRTDAARRMIATSRRMVEELGITQRLLEADVFAGLIELLEGDATAAERSLRAAYEGLRDQGLGIDAAQAAALLGRALLALDRAAEAETLSHESEALAGDDLKAAIAWRGVRAEALARRGEHAAAVELARASVDIAAATDALLDHADARLALAAALRAAGRGAEASAEEARAIELWEAKGATLLAERARQEIGRIPPKERAADDGSVPARPMKRPVRTNAATEFAARLDAALGAKDTDALPDLFSDDVQVVEYVAGTIFDRRETLLRFRELTERDAKYRHEPLGTLGDSLGLFYLSILGRGESDANLDLGPYDWEEIVLVEADPRARARRGETFATDRLGDAVARIYERYAELLPEGPERERASAIARSGAALAGPLEHHASAFSPEVEGHDHRPVVGFGKWRGEETLRNGLRVLLELLGSRGEYRITDVVALQLDALLVRARTSGEVALGGGAYERLLTQLYIFGADGLVIRFEQFDADQGAEALARFEDLTAVPPRTTKPARHVRPNAATANVAKLDAAIAARDVDGLDALFGAEMRVVNHNLAGGVYDRRGALKTWRTLLSAQDPTCRHEPLATLGDSLALCRQSLAATGFAGARFDVGAYEREAISFVEVDSNGLQQHAEFFAPERLGDAVVRLYERCAEIMPDGAARHRAAATACSLATLVARDLDRYATALAPDARFHDERRLGMGASRGVDALVRGMRSLFEVADDLVFRVDDIVALRPDAILTRETNLGRLREGGGVFERHFLQLLAFGADGRLTRGHLFDVDREDDALARFEELTGTSPPHPAPRDDLSPTGRGGERRVAPNRATTNVARVLAAVAAQDADDLAAQFADDLGVIHHPTGGRYGREGLVASFRALFRAEQPAYRLEPIATIGDSLALCNQFVAAERLGSGSFDVGAYERDETTVIEVDGVGRLRRVELFGSDRLADALTRLFERYAETLPEGSERERATTTSRAVAAVLGPIDLDRYAAAFHPAIEFADRRYMGVGVIRGAERTLASLRALLESTRDAANRVEDVLALRSDAFLFRLTNFGTQRSSGGAYERPFLFLWIFGADGRAMRMEQFDPDRETEALARFDELVAAPSEAAPRPKRRVRANAATQIADRLDAAVVAHDADAVSRLLGEEMEFIHHPVGTVHGRQGVVDSYALLFKAEELEYRNEPIATLGDALALCRRSYSFAALSEEKLRMGAGGDQAFTLIEADEHGRSRRWELFSEDRLGDAVARLYERYAEILPEGPARSRAATIARFVALMPIGPAFDIDRYPQAIAPTIEFFDHRTVGIGSAHGAKAYLEWINSIREVAESWTFRIDDILALRPDGWLLRVVNSGRERATGGDYERHFLPLFLFGPDGLHRHEQFDDDCEERALARFDELTRMPHILPARRVRPNVATTYADRLDAAMAAGDLEALEALDAETDVIVDHPTGSTTDRAGNLLSRRMLLNARDLEFGHEALATLGDSFALHRMRAATSGVRRGNLDVGPYEAERLIVGEVDREGRGLRAELFAPDDLSQALARLYAMYADTAPEGIERTRAAAVARTVAAWFGPLDIDRSAAVLDPSIEFIDHRTLGTWSARGPEAIVRHLRAHEEVAESIAFRIDDVIALYPDVLLTRATSYGKDRAGGGDFERLYLSLLRFGADGRITHGETFDVHREAEALARFDELTAPSMPPARSKRRVRPNAASAFSAGVSTAFSAGDLDGVAKLLADEYAVTEHATGVVYDKTGALYSYRTLLNARDPKHLHEPLATLGESLALARVNMSAGGKSGAKYDVGAYEIETHYLCEVDARGRGRRAEMFAPERLGDAVVRLYERYAELLPEGPERELAAATARSIAVTLGPLDLDWWAAALDPSVENVDHRTLGTWSSRGAEAHLQNLRALLEVTESVTLRIDDVLAVRPDAFLARWTNFGTDRAGGGTFERPYLTLWRFGADGRITQTEVFDVDHEAEALARFDELTSPHARPNAATAAMDRLQAAWDARNWAAVRAACTPGAKYEDRRRQSLVSGDLEFWIADMMGIVERTPDVRGKRRLVATFGERVGLERMLWTGEVGWGRFEIEELLLTEVDERGRITAFFEFDLDDARAAHAEARALALAVDKTEDAEATLAAERPALRIENAATRSVERFEAAWQARDWQALTALFAPGYLDSDRRPIAYLDIDRERYLESLRRVFETAVSDRASELLATRGDRLALFRTIWRGSGRTVGPSEVEWLGLIEVDELGRRVAGIVWDPGDPDAAYAELEARFRAGEGATYRPAFVRAIEARDWEAATAQLAPDFVLTDHRPLGWEPIHGAAVYVAMVKSLVELAPDVRVRFDHLTQSKGAVLAVAAAVGTWQIGAFERSTIIVGEYDALGRVRRFHFYNHDQFGEAQARFAKVRFDPLRVPANAASCAGLRSLEVLKTCDWATLDALCAPTLVFEDRRRLARTSGGRDMFIASSKVVGEGVRVTEGPTRGGHVEPTLLAVADDRLALMGIRWSSTEPVRAELENLQLYEVDADGRIVAMVSFEPEDRRAANVELLARFARGEGARPGLAAMVELGRAIADHDLERVGSLLPADFVWDDHRRTGAGRLDRKSYLAYLESLFELSPDVFIEVMYVMAVSSHGVLAVGHGLGTHAEGGAFEWIFAALWRFLGDELAGAEMFELEDLDVARARFEALGTEAQA